MKQQYNEFETWLYDFLKNKKHDDVQAKNFTMMDMYAKYYGKQNIHNMLELQDKILADIEIHEWQKLHPSDSDLS